MKLRERHTGFQQNRPSDLIPVPFISPRDGSGVVKAQGKEGRETVMKP
jgi:hypothetical protein